LQWGRLVAIVAILLSLTTYFQSFRLSTAIILTIPAVVAGAAVMLWLTHTTLNIQSYMGTIMAVGIAVANSILLVTFAERTRLEGHDAAAAAIKGAGSRLRPIVMTGSAMIAGMIPMALGLSEAGQQTAPLARAVIGGLSGGMCATLLVLPAIFTALSLRSSRRSASLDPGDPQSANFEAGVPTTGDGEQGEPEPAGPPGPSGPEPVEGVARESGTAADLGPQDRLSEDVEARDVHAAGDDHGAEHPESETPEPGPRELRGPHDEARSVRVTGDDGGSEEEDRDETE
jgi:hypothetical protein